MVEKLGSTNDFVPGSGERVIASPDTEDRDLSKSADFREVSNARLPRGVSDSWPMPWESL